MAKRSGSPLIVRGLVFANVITLGACGSVSAVADLPAQDLAAPATPDLVTTNLPTPDLATPDLVTANVPAPDLATPDLVTANLPTPDLAGPDLTTPVDQVAADLTAPTCADGVKNGTETGVDCGGASCPRCVAGQGCGKGSDCVSGVCISTCRALNLSFASPMTFGAGPGPIEIAAADFNGDKAIDLIVSDYDSTTVTALINNGNGTSFTPFMTDVKSNPFGIGTGDFDGDGMMDAVVVVLSAAKLIYLHGNGTGNFTAIDVATVASAHDLAVADVNLDGHLDVLLGAGPSGLHIFLGDGTGGFKDHAIASETGQFPAVADINRDGKPDIVIGDQPITLYLGDGMGSFANTANYSAAATTYLAGTADFNLDKAPDVAAAVYGGSKFSVWLNSKTGGLVARNDYPASVDIVRAAIGDFNVDGWPDLVGAGWGGTLLGVALNKADGSGTMALPTTFAMCSGAGHSQPVAADFNGDGKTDLAVTCYGNASVMVRLNTSN